MTCPPWFALGALLLAAPALAEEPPVPEEAPAEAPAASTPTNYTINTGSSTLLVAIRNDTSAWASRLGHDHAIVASDFTGKVVWDATDASKCNISFSIPVSKLVVDPAGSRERMGFHGVTSDSDKETITTNFRSEGQLNMAAHPTISFQSTSCSGTSGKVDVKGNFTMRGTTKPVTAAMNVTVDGSTFKASGGFESTHTYFDFEPFQALGGNLRNQDRLQFVLDVKGTAG